MPKRTRRTGERQSGLEQRRHEELINITCRIFAAKGFAGASLQDIADEFGILKGSLFHYIQSKDDLLYEIIKGVYVGAESTIWSIIEEDGSASFRLRKLIIAYVTYVAEHQPEVTVWLHDLNSLAPSRREEITRFEERDRRRLTDFIYTAQLEGAIPEDSDPQIVSFALLGAMNWVHRWYRPGRMTPQQVGEAIARLYVRNRTPEPDDLSPVPQGNAQGQA